MSAHFATEFLIADASRARWVRRAADGRGFVTTAELANERPARHRPPLGVAFESSTGRPFTVERFDEALKRRAAFAADLAAAIEGKVARGEAERYVVIAPPRMLNAILASLSTDAASRVAVTLARDLTKTPDHDLTPWLTTLEFPSRAERRRTL